MMPDYKCPRCGSEDRSVRRLAPEETGLVPCTDPSHDEVEVEEPVPTRLEAEQDIKGWSSPRALVRLDHADGSVDIIEGTVGVISWEYDPVTGALALVNFVVVVEEPMKSGDSA